MTEEQFRKSFLILLVAAISVAFVAMIRMFLLTILLAAIFSGIARPFYLMLLRKCGGRRSPAALATLVLLLVLVIVPLILLASVVATEAVRVATSVRPWIEARVAEPDFLDDALRRMPYVEYLEPVRETLMTRGAAMVGAVGTFLAETLSTVTRGTVLFLVHFVLLLYAMFFFLIDGPRLLQSMMSYLPLADEDKERMLDKFVSVTRATLKGTVLIGVIQGVLAGLAFWAIGIDGAIFWTTLMVVLSIVPGVGGALVWVPAVVLLLVQGAIWQGVGLTVYCGLLVGSVDNILRPRLVGRDTRMHDLLILFSTLGGLMVLGATGFILGPILAALFITVWEMFGVAFRDILPARRNSAP
jgi:predicted PurR-regulated permease PerM